MLFKNFLCMCDYSCKREINVLNNEYKFAKSKLNEYHHTLPKSISVCQETPNLISLILILSSKF